MLYIALLRKAPHPYALDGAVRFLLSVQDKRDVCVCTYEHIHMVNECLTDTFKENQCVWEMEKSKGKVYTLCVRLSGKRSFIGWLLRILCQLNERKEEIFGVVVSRQRCVCVRESTALYGLCMWSRGLLLQTSTLLGP